MTDSKIELVPRAAVTRYSDLRVWHAAMDLVVEVYRVSAAFPTAEMYGLRSQVRKAAASVAANIAEGHGRDYLGDYLYHLSVANGSLMEVETHLLIAERLRYIDAAERETLFRSTADVGRMLAGLSRALKRRRPSEQPNT